MKETFTVPTGLRFEGRETYGPKTLLFFTELDETAASYGTTFALKENEAQRSSFSIVEKRAAMASLHRKAGQ